MMVQPYPVTKSSARHLINLFNVLLPILNIPKPKSFHLGCKNLDSNMLVIKPFDKQLSIGKTKTKAFH